MFCTLTKELRVTMLVDPTAQLIALIIQGVIGLLLATIVWLVRRAYITIRDSLHRLEDVQDRLGGLEERDAIRANENRVIREQEALKPKKKGRKS